MTRPAVIPRQIELEHLQPSDRYGAYAVIRNLLPLFMLNDWIGLLLGAVTGIDHGRFRALHGKHHRLYGRAEDPQGFHYLGVQRLSRVQFAWHLVKPLFGANLGYVAREHAPSRKLVARHASRPCRGLPVDAASDVHCRPALGDVSISLSCRSYSQQLSVCFSASFAACTFASDCTWGVQRVCSWVVQVEQMARAVVAVKRSRA